MEREPVRFPPCYLDVFGNPVTRDTLGEPDLSRSGSENSLAGLITVVVVVVVVVVIFLFRFFCFVAAAVVVVVGALIEVGDSLHCFSHASFISRRRMIDRSIPLPLIGRKQVSGGRQSQPHRPKIIIIMK